MNIIVTHALSSDIKAMSSLVGELFAIETDFEINEEKQIQALSLLQPNPMCDVIVAKEGERVVGMATMQPVISTAEGGYVGIIEDVIVTKSHRKQGIGSKLVAFLEECALKRRYKVVKLLADKENTDALHFYKSQHFAQTRLIMLRKRF